MAILSMVLLMEDLMVKDALMKAELIHSSFGAPSNYIHDELIRCFGPLVDNEGMVDLWYVDGEYVDYCQMMFFYVCRYFLSF